MSEHADAHPLPTMAEGEGPHLWVREAQQADLAAVVALAADGRPDAPSPQGAVGTWKERLRQPAQRLYVLELALGPKDAHGVGRAGPQQLAAGYVVAATHIAVVMEQAEVVDLWVGPAFRGRGCATALLRGAADALIALGVREVVLEVRRDNAPARAVYDKLGFTQVGLRPGYYSVSGSGPPTPASDALLLRTALPLTR